MTDLASYMASTPTFSTLLFLGGPLHGSRYEMPDTTRELVIRSDRSRTYSPNLWDRYTRRTFTRIAGDEQPEVAHLFAHETWLDEEISASHLAERDWKPKEAL